MKKHDYRIKTIVQKIRDALDRIDRAEEYFAEFGEDLPVDDQILKSNLLSALDLLEKYEFQ